MGIPEEGVWRMIQWCVGVGKRKAITKGDWGGMGILREYSCKWIRTYGSLLTMEGKFQRDCIENWAGGDLLRGFRIRKKA